MDAFPTDNTTRKRVEDAVLAAISETLAVPLSDVNEDQRLIADLNADSMSVLSIMLVLEDSLNIEIDISDIPESDITVRSIVDHLANRLNQ